MSTKTGQRIARAFRDGANLTIGRTVAFRDRWMQDRHGTWGGMACVSLHGHTIAYQDCEDVVWMTLAGYPTQVTRDRLNAICDAYGSENRFWQHDFRQYYGDNSGPYYGRNTTAIEIADHEWVPIAGPLGMQALEASRSVEAELRPEAAE